MTKQFQTRWAWILAGIFLLSLIPLYVLGFFAHPSVDDYYYGAETARTWQEGGDLGAVIRQSWALMKNSYQSWQGNFLAIFLMRLQPGIFGEESYFWAPLILITSLAAGLIFFFYTALRRLVRAGRPAAAGMALAVSFCAIQFCYKPSDSFYWFNGGIYYTFFFALSYCMLGLMILALKAEKKGSRLAALTGASLLAFLIGGGNYSTALSLAVLLAVLLGHSFLPSLKLKKLPLLLPLLALLISLVISILAPGNALRQAAAGEGPGVIKALIYSFAYGGYVLAEGMKLPLLILWLGLMPFLYRLSRRVPGRYPMPLLVLLFSFGIFASQGTALFYAQGLRMPPRMSNIIYFNAYLFTGFNLFYFCGWLRRRCPGNMLERVSDGLLSRESYLKRYALVLLLAFAIGCLGLWQVSEGEKGQARFETQPLSVSAAYSLLRGEARIYDRELTERASYLASQPEGASVTIPALSVYPQALTHSEVTEDPSDFKNEHLALFYHLGSVALEK